MSRTFAILKPLHEKSDPASHNKIRAILKANGFSFVREETKVLSRALLETHYAHHADKAFFNPMIDYLVSGDAVLLVLEKEGDAVVALRELSGPTDPKKGTVGLIRHDFGLHLEGVLHKNAIHASGNVEEAHDECLRFFGTDLI